jgi:hypothetical protein
MIETIYSQLYCRFMQGEAGRVVGGMDMLFLKKKNSTSMHLLQHMQQMLHMLTGFLVCPID